MATEPGPWDHLDPEFRALIEAVAAEYAKDPLMNDTPERAAFLAAAMENLDEFEREFGPFSEESTAWAEAELDRVFGKQEDQARNRRSS